MSTWYYLEVMGSGTLAIDVLTGGCAHNGVPVEQVPITRVLQKWISDSFGKHKIKTDKIRRVELVAELNVSPPKYGSRFTICEIGCRAIIETDEVQYEGRFEDREEWESKQAKRIRGRRGRSIRVGRISEA